MTQQDRIDRGLYWDRAWSLVEGCSPVSPGCLHCWAARQTHVRAGQSNPKIQARYGGLTRQGRWTGEIRLMHGDLQKPLQIKKPTTWAIWNDLFHEDVPEDFIWQAIEVAWKASWHTFQILTKRPGRMLDILTRSVWWNNDAPGNIWLGVTAENQAAADERIPILLQIPAAVRFVSCEPLLGPVDIEEYLLVDGCHTLTNGEAFPNICLACGGNGSPVLDWVIVGGESGPGARPMHPQWAREIRDQCQAAHVPFFMKQMAKKAPIPDDLMIREMPNVNHDLLKGEHQ